MWQTLGQEGAGGLGLFMAAVLVLNATPGVDLLLTVTRTLQGGARAGLAVALGIALGCVVHALAAAFGLAALLALSPLAFVALKWAGAAVLVWLAAGMLRRAWRGAAPQGVAAAGGAAAAGAADAAGEGGAAPPAPRFGAELRVGFLTNVLNPKVALFFLAFLPQFIAPATTHKTLAFLALGACFVVQSALFLGLVVWAVDAMAVRARRLRARPALGRALNAAGAGLFGWLAVKVVNA